MYLKGSKWSVSRRSKKRSSPVRVIILAVVVGAAFYFNQVVVPTIPPLFVPTPTPTRSPESYITSAETLLAEGKTTLAIQAYTEAIQVNPKNPNLYLSLARLQVNNKAYEEALTNTENALLLNPNNSSAHALRGNILGYMGDYLLAESAINTALELDPNNGVAQAYLAEVLILQGQTGTGPIGATERAIEASRLALNLNPNSSETHHARGLVLEYTSNYAEAMVEYQTALTMDPNSAKLHMALGRAYRYLEQYDKAVEEFNLANALNPADSDPDTYISRTYATIGEFNKAIQYAEQAVKDSPEDPYMYGNLGLMNFRNLEYGNSLKNLGIAIQGGRTDTGEEVEGLPLDYGRIAEYYYTYGLSQARTNDCTGALRISQLLLENVPTDEYAMYNAEAIVEICKESAGYTATPQSTGEALEATPEATGTP